MKLFELVVYFVLILIKFYTFLIIHKVCNLFSTQLIFLELRGSTGQPRKSDETQQELVTTTKHKNRTTDGDLRSFV